jgi:hypothetical protein
MVWQGEGLASVIPIKPERLRRVSATISRGFIGSIICRLHAALRHKTNRHVASPQIYSLFNSSKLN